MTKTFLTSLKLTIAPVLGHVIISPFSWDNLSKAYIIYTEIAVR